MDGEELAGGYGQAVLQSGLAAMGGLVGDHLGTFPQPLGCARQGLVHRFALAGVIDDDELEVLEGLRSNRLDRSGEHQGTIPSSGHHGDSWGSCGLFSHLRGSSLIR